MDVISDLIYEIISKQVLLLEQMQQNATEASRRAAAYSALALRLEAERAAVQKCFEHDQKTKKRLYESANNVLSEAIKTGNDGLAAIALRVIDIAHSKTVFTGGEYNG